MDEKCSHCDAPLSAALRYCPACQSDVGAPNVRRCQEVENVRALNENFAAVRKKAMAAGFEQELDAVSTLLARDSGVVITMRAGVARKLFEDPKAIYANYEQLVGAQARTPANDADDRRRCAVGGALFGSYAGAIHYGVLSLTAAGLPTYGSLYCRFRSVSVNKRTTFLETNSYKFVEERNLVGGTIPLGCMASWEQRNVLAAVKMADNIKVGQTVDDLQAILLQSDGESRNNDEFVEAHIFGGFDRNAIESVVPVPRKKLDKGERLDLKIVLATFGQSGAREK